MVKQENRELYLDALESASVEKNIKPFALDSIKNFQEIVLAQTVY